MSWFSDLRDSFRMDRAEEVRTAAHGSTFSASPTAQVDRSLRDAPAPIEPPEGLHLSIMSRIRNASAEPKRKSGVASIPALVSWGRAATAAALVLILTAMFVRVVPHQDTKGNSNNNPTLTEQATALPSKVISPLSRELESLQKDIQSTTSFLLASVPSLED